MGRLRKFLCVSLILLMMLGIIGCIDEKNNERNVVSKTQPLAAEEQVPEYVMTKEVFKNKDGEVYGTVKYNYDDQGHLLQVKYVNQEGKIIESKQFKYNEQGLRTKRIVTKACKKRMEEEWRYNTYDRKKLREKKPREVWYIRVAGWPIWKEGTTTYKYNKWGQLLAYKEVKKDGTKVRWGRIEYYKDGDRKYKWIERYDGAKQEIYYNEDGKCKKRVTNNENGSRKVKKAYYNGNRNKIKETTKKKNSSGKIIEKSNLKKEYNKNGKLIKSIWQEEIYELHFITKYKYNKNGNIIEKLRKEKDGKIDYRYLYKYNDKGQERKFIHKEDDEVWYVVEYQYDEEGNEIKEVEKSSTGKVKDMKRYYYKKLK